MGHRPHLFPDRAAQPAQRRDLLAVAHEPIVRREAASSMGSVSFSIFSFLNRISSRAPDFFRIPQDAIIEVGFRVEI
jgi:K+ transporter